jgi:hypothetical protein
MHLQKTGPTPVVLGTLANPAIGGVPRPDGVKIKLGDLLRKHGVGWGLVLTGVPPAPVSVSLPRASNTAAAAAASARRRCVGGMGLGERKGVIGNVPLRRQTTPTVATASTSVSKK